MIKVHGKFESEDLPFEPDAGTYSFPEFSISYIQHLDKAKQKTDKASKKKIIAVIVFENETLSNFNVFQFNN